jgi:hypothetical protein
MSGFVTHKIDNKQLMIEYQNINTFAHSENTRNWRMHRRWA